MAWDLLQRAAQKADVYQRRHAWLGFPLGVKKKFSEDDAGSLAALIAYYSFFSLFPLLLALVTVVGFVLHGSPELQRRIIDSALADLPVLGDQIRASVGTLTGSGTALVGGVWPVAPHQDCQDGWP